MPVRDRTVLVIDDLGDSGDTMRLASDHVMANGAGRVLTLVPYMNRKRYSISGQIFPLEKCHRTPGSSRPGNVSKHWMKRVPVWKQRGATEQECRRRLCDLIGYSTAEVNYYLPVAYDLG